MSLVIANAFVVVDAKQQIRRTTLAQPDHLLLTS